MMNKNSICEVTCELYVRDGIFGELSTHNKSDCLIGMLKRHKEMRDVSKGSECRRHGGRIYQNIHKKIALKFHH